MTKEELKKVREVLVRARARIEDPARWCRGKYARNRSGEPVSAGNVEAWSFCAIGSLMAETNSQWHEHAPYARGHIFLREAAEQLYGNPLVSTVNDGAGHGAVMAIYDRAINQTLDEEAAMAGVE